MSRRAFRHLLAGTAFFCLTSGLVISGLPLPQHAESAIAQPPIKDIQATSGGKMGGGGFGSDTAPSDNSRSNSGRSSSDNRTYDNTSDNRSGESGSRSSDIFWGLIFGGLMLTPAGRRMASRFFMSVLEQTNKEGNNEGARPTRYDADVQSPARPIARSAAGSRVFRQKLGEIANNVVTVTQVQVAMQAEARHVQQALTQIATETDFSTQKGLTIGLRETVVTLLRAPETWTHAIATTKTLKSKQTAKTHFEGLSIEERSKFDVESLVNIDGDVKKRDRIQAQDETASHIVVTLLIGTAHDSAIIDPVMSIEELQKALKRLGSITPEYLMVYEILWSPQDESDSLTEDELLLNYPKMYQLT